MQEELKELSHEAWPGYKKTFLIVFGILIIYLLIILLSDPHGVITNAHH
jgi:hypothetical protein